jgi:Amt family ammonium transporter
LAHYLLDYAGLKYWSSAKMEVIVSSNDVLFVLLGAIMVLAMHAGFAFLEVGTVRKKNQVNALVKIMVDFSISTIAYFFIGYSIAYGVNFFSGAEVLAAKNGFGLVKFLLLSALNSIRNLPQPFC